MRFTRASVNWWLLGGGIALLLLIGIQQYRWIERASEAERQERRQFLRNALGGVRNDMMERLRRPLATLRSDAGFTPGSHYAELLKTRFDQWRQSGIDSTMIDSMTIGWSNEQGKIECCRMGPADRAYSECEWPPALNAYRTLLDQQMLEPGGGPPFFPGGNALSYSGSRLVMIFPIVEMSQLPSVLPNRGINLAAKAPPGLSNAASPPPRPTPPELRGWCFLEIDPEFLRQLVHELGLILALTDLLADEGYDVTTATDGAAGFALAKGGRFNLILLDVMLPEKNGFDVCRDLRQLKVSTPILMLTARGQLVDKVVGLKLGADDYLTKPFEPLELLARLEALLRRNQPQEAEKPADVFRFGSITVNFRSTEVRRNNQVVELSAREFSLLRFFIEQRGATLSRQQLLVEVWGYDAETLTRTVDVHVAMLRQKLEDDAKQPRHFITVRGMGYKFVDQPGGGNG